MYTHTAQSERARAIVSNQLRDDQSYDHFYRGFDSPLMQRLRREAYGEDIGQHSWVTAGELKESIPRLALTADSRLLDLGCGPGGPLAFLVGQVGCHGDGVDLSAEAIAVGNKRAASSELDRRIIFRQADLRDPLPFANGSFDAAMALDVVFHLHDRCATFREAARVLVPGGRFLLTDAGVLTGCISNEDVLLRSIHGYSQFVAPGFNERTLEAAGFNLMERCDRTASLLKNASGRLSARLAHRAELESLEGSAYFDRQQQYLETTIALAQRGALSRMMYVAETRGQ